ncbi:MAG: Flp pilus assembly complex ATPase component TadA, partial [Clostridia bacterium]|nr:Flp pilus assembly complex ATPase component TadA [Clostridia bacterium]
GGLTRAFINEEEFIFLPDYYSAEKYCANRILLSASVPPTEVPVSLSRLEQVERETGVIYDKVQKQAITTALSSGMLVLTGGPGTGKTTTLKAIISLLKENGEKIALAAPTGRAAKRMSELCGEDAKTIHRLLEVEWGENDRQIFKRNEKNPLEFNCIIVDELSMMDIKLFEALLKAMRVDCRLILVGDVDQLPSVGAGNVLNDIIESGVVSQVRLEKIFRQAQKSFIVTNAHRIIKGNMPKAQQSDSDFYIVNSNEPDELITSLYCTRLHDTFGFTPENTQVLCPSKKRKTGTVNINNKLQSIINPENLMTKKQIKRKGFVLREGDKVMQIRNNYDVIWTKQNGDQGSGIFNGDIGVLEKIDKQTSTITVNFDDKIAMFTGEEIDDITLAYAITVHKSQGSEFDCVILPVCDLPPQLKYRNLLYTAVTRAKKLLIIVGKGADIKAMIDNDKKTLRYTAFRQFLKGQISFNGDF